MNRFISLDLSTYAYWMCNIRVLELLDMRKLFIRGEKEIVGHAL